MIDFNKDSIFNLRETSEDKLNKNIEAILLDDEEVLGVYKTVRDEVVFTSDRIITMDVQGVTGLKRELSTIPYKRIQYFSVQTAGLVELIPDNELYLHMADGFDLRFEFKSRSKIIDICKAISLHSLR